jgi:hypothetical protein
MPVIERRENDKVSLDELAAERTPFWKRHESFAGSLF